MSTATQNAPLGHDKDVSFVPLLVSIVVRDHPDANFCGPLSAVGLAMELLAEQPASANNVVQIPIRRAQRPGRTI